MIIPNVERNVENLLLRIALLLENLSNNSINNGFFLPITSTDTDAPNNSIYFSSTANKLVYKDSFGVINNLY